MLELLRPVADEIIVAADSRVDEDDLAHYAAVADELHRIEVDHSERHFGWLHAQCSGDWILRIDGDEIPSTSLLEALPTLIADRNVVQYLIPRCWLHGDPGHWLSGAPWWPDYQLRLVRNDGTLRFPSTQHTSAVPTRPARYLEEPIYHLDLLVNTLEHRQAKALAYERRAPGLQAPGGGPINERFYLPERHDRADLAPVPIEDRGSIATALEGHRPTPSALEQMPPARSVAETDRFNPHRKVSPEACAARITAIETAVRMRAGERRPIHFRFTNAGSDRWPWDADLGPPIRASYHLRNDRGTVVVPDGPRTPFPCSLEPGASTVVPLDVIAPVVPGRYEMAVDVVHEGVRWFGSELRTELSVEPPPAWSTRTASPSVRLRSRAARLLRRREATLPSIIHRVWLGERELPAAARRYGEGWQEHHPHWEHRLWSDADMRELVPAASVARCRNASERSNLVRYAVLARFGGVYVDTDVECRRPIGDLVAGLQAFAAWQSPNRLGTAILGSTPGHPAMRAAAAASLVTAGLSVNSVEATGPGLLTLLAAERSDIELFASDLFYPYRRDEPERRGELFEHAYAVHHWDLSWKGETGASDEGGAAQAP